MKGADTMKEIPIPETVYGVDFSGAEKAGKKIWIAQAVPDGDGLSIMRCQPATECFGVGSGRDIVLKKLVDLVANSEKAVFGCDFPFGLPANKVPELVPHESWAEFIAEFPARYTDARQFNKKCKQATQRATNDRSKEVKRKTDEVDEAGAPWPAYNERLFRQTYYVIRDVLRPIVLDRKVNIPPIHYTGADATWIIEVCPASTLKALGLYGGNKSSFTVRKYILEAFEEKGRVVFEDDALRRKVLQDNDCDALDSVIAADAAYRAMCNPKHIKASEQWPYTIEGYIYV